jgi:hypothetical protein
MALLSTNGTREPRAFVADPVETRARQAADDRSRAEYEECAYLEKQSRQLMAEAGTLALFQDALMEIVQDEDFKASTYRFLLILFIECKPANYIDWSAHGLSRKYAMGYQGALNAWKLLVHKDWLRRVPGDSGFIRYRLSPYLCWRGRPWKARIAQKNWDAEAQLATLAQTWEHEQP